jgi:subtilisin family serine protease
MLPGNGRARHLFFGCLLACCCKDYRPNALMKKNFSTSRWFFIPVMTIFLLIQLTSAAQSNGPIEEGVVRIKVREDFAAQLEQARLSKRADDVVVTGIASFDAFNRQYQVKDLKRVFRPAGKFETRHRRYGLHRWYELRIDKAASVVQAITTYQSLIQIEKAEPVYKKAIIGSQHKNFGPRVVNANQITREDGLPEASNDPLLGNQWHYHNTGQTGGTPGADIDLFPSWQLETGKKEVIVAITDGGIQTDHQDLVDNVWVNTHEIPGNGKDDDNNGFIDDVHGYSFVDNSGVIAPEAHGTHVAGTVAATTNNGVGVAGVAGGSGTGDGVRVMSCAVFSETGEGGFSETYVYAADQGAVISQNSWGYVTSGTYEQSVLDAIDYFIAEAGKDENGNQVGPMNGGIVIFAAGNDGLDEDFYPGYYPPTLTVAATTHQDKKAYYSNFGTWVDLSAPGGETNTVVEQGVMSTLPNNQYGFFQGTSMACPHVSGIAALLVSKFGKAGFRPEALRARILQTTDDIDKQNPDFIGALGAGRLNAYKALYLDDDVPPATINNLVASPGEIGEMILTWTSPADGTFVSAYDIRYAASPITAENFAAAAMVRNEPFPKPAGSVETFTVSGLAGGTLYYFAIRSIDFDGNSSAISNVASQVTVLAPTIEISPDSLAGSLQTAQTSTKTFIIRNTGHAPLKFSLINPAGENGFASSVTAEGTLAPGNEQVVTVTFSAEGLLAGTYRQNLIIQSNDPERNKVSMLLTLQVTNNNAPIVSFTPDSINFKSVQTGTSSSRSVTIRNAGSNPLLIDEVASGNPDMTTDFTADRSVSAFGETTITVTFSPTATGFATGLLTIHTNDPANPVLQVYLEGEGLSEPPLVVMPAAIDEVLDKGRTSTKTIVIRNNGSYDRSFTTEIVDKGLGEGLSVAGRQRTTSFAVEALPAGKTKEAVRAAVSSGPGEINTLLNPIRRPVENAKANASARTSSLKDTLLEYTTGFENFTIGKIDGQEDWFAGDGWTVETNNPYSGEKHLQGVVSDPGAGQAFALSPNLATWQQEVLPYITSASMKVNLDNTKGVTWEIVPQDPETYITTRIRFNGNGTVEAMVIRNDYEPDWKPIHAEVPSGYFEVGVELDNRGNDTTGFSIFHIYFNNKEVFAGAGISATISQVAFLTQSELAGPVFAVDDLTIVTDEYIPGYVTAHPASGTIPAGGSATITLDFDAGDMKFGTYHSDLIIHPDEAAPLIVPVTLSVTGKASLAVTPRSLEKNLYPGKEKIMTVQIANTGGTPFNYALHLDAPWFKIVPDSGALAVRGSVNATARFSARNVAPGLYFENLEIRTDVKELPLFSVPVHLTIWEPRAVFSITPRTFQVEAIKGQKVTKTIQVRNQGEGTVSFDQQLTFQPLPSWVSVYPSSGKVAATPKDVTLTFDTSPLPEGTHTALVAFRSNDSLRTYITLNVTVVVRPDPNHAPEITAIPDKTVTERESLQVVLNAGDEDDDDVSITLQDPPSFVTLVTSGNGSATYAITPPLGAKGEYTLLAVATDSKGKKDSASFKLTVVPYGIANFSLVNTRTGKVITNFEEEITVDRADPNFKDLIIRANTTPGIVGSTVFGLHGKKTIVNSFPYDLKRPMEPLASGRHVLTADVYTKEKARGDKGYGRQTTITVVNTAAVLKFEVVTTTGTVLQVLENGSVINIGDPIFRSSAIRADVGDKKIRNVMFIMNNWYWHQESQAPYSLYGDSHGRYNGWRLRTGNYTLTAIPDWEASPGQSLTISFTIIDEGLPRHHSPALAGNSVEEESVLTREEEVLLNVFPVPVKDELTVQVAGYGPGEAEVMISSIYGQFFYRRPASGEQLRELRISTQQLGLLPGVYYVHIIGANGAGLVRKFVKE